MIYLLDTNICIYALKNTFPRIKYHMEPKSPSDIAIPSIVKAELYCGANKSSKKEDVIQALDKFLAPFSIVPFGDSASYTYANIRAKLECQGNLIGPNDLIIAATAMAHGTILITHNIKEFSKVEGLQTEDWTLGAR